MTEQLQMHLQMQPEPLHLPQNQSLLYSVSRRTHRNHQRRVLNLH